MSIEDDIARADEPAYVREAEALARVEELESELAQVASALANTTAALISESSPTYARLLRVYVAAVSHLLHTISEERRERTIENRAARIAAEVEVRTLTALHLTPSAHKPGA